MSMIPLLQPIFQGDWAPHGETVQCSPPPPGAILVADLVSRPGLLADVMARHAGHLGVTGRDWRAVASAWSLDYLWTLLPPVVAAASLLQHRFPVSPARMALVLDDDAHPVRFHIGDLGEAMPGTGTVERYSPLLHEHLQPLFAALHRETRVAEKILWANTARYLGEILEQGIALAGPLPPLVADQAMLLEGGSWPEGRGNPMLALPRRSACDAAGQRVTLHRHCCLYYLLPEQPYCGGCPLAPQHRATLRTTAPTA
ncbi:siderophore-iron reductase FhuF [Mitsuaria sp. GD03876]|uniref:siderophore-iron reductase FhuF n=1 Tax=Mitsuaria sp. GD03876 TaxID=2975399 RepID=UPI00244ACD15|nr:siderophore-iron reductase FhuF [Mitsuaria sp. GD03876]MDH0864415.1 siderophore-iron reductase FhuF [Mitsuaria sp. GD03876]